MEIELLNASLGSYRTAIFAEVVSGIKDYCGYTARIQGNRTFKSVSIYSHIKDALVRERQLCISASKDMYNNVSIQKSNAMLALINEALNPQSAIGKAITKEIHLQMLKVKGVQ